MIELEANQYQVAQALFRQTHYGVLTAGTLNGTHPGRVFVDNLPAPQSALVCSRTGMGYYFLAGAADDGFIGKLPGLFNNDLLPAQKASHNNSEILLFFPEDSWKEKLFEQFKNRRPILIHKKRMVLSEEARQKVFLDTKQLPDSFTLSDYTQSLLFQYPELAEEAIFLYGSVERFLQNGLGVCIHNGEKIASQCSSVFTGAGEIEISITTSPDYRQRGLAKICATAFIQECLEWGLNPIWGCWPENIPSVNLAAKLGFIDDSDQPVCFWMDNP